jgi:ADP-ribose pyrophosphatase
MAGRFVGNNRIEGPLDESTFPVKLLKRELAHKGKVIDVYTDTVEVNGNVTNWDFIHHNGAAAVVAVNDDGRLMMVRQFRHALRRFTLEIPAGKLDGDKETTESAAARELEEETGYRCDRLEYLISLNTTVAFCDEAIDVFLARNLVKTHQHLDEDEEINVELWSVDDLKKKIFAGEITDAKTVAAILAYDAKTRR